MKRPTFPRHVQIALELCSVAGSPYAKTASSMLSNGVFKLPSLNPDAYSHWRSFSLDYAIYTYLRKFRGSGKDIRRLDHEALLSFKETEDRVARFNRSYPLSAALAGAGHGTSVMRRKIRQILGRFDASEWFASCEWGPGATSSLSAADATLDKKILEPKLSVSPRALPFFKAFLEADIHMFASRAGIVPEGPYSVTADNFRVVDSSRLTTVDKSITERRVIDIQPTCNLFLQKGIGSMIRRRLKRHGVDLDDQSRNQWLASVAQRLQLCTIDLAKASDTVSKSLVLDLLPDDWFFALNALRTEFTTYKGEKLYLNKFSAMGNGYTFELESLIFFSLLLAAEELEGSSARDPLGVYGDDLICHRRLSRYVLRLLTECGFEVNSEKSFLRGRFYESCGKHYFDGKDVTPPYQKEELSDFVSCCRAANRLFRYAMRLGNGDLDSTLFTSWQLASSFAWEEWDRWMRFREQSRRRRLPFPFIPWWLEEDSSGLLAVKTFPIKDGLLRYSKLTLQGVKCPADMSALYATSIRRGCVVESPFLGLVAMKGRVGKAVHGVAKTTPLTVRFPDWY